MNLFIVIGTGCLIASELYLPWRLQWRLMNRTFGGIYHGFRTGEMPRRPMWLRALGILGLGLLALGLWRLLSGL